MARQQAYPSIAALRELEASLHADLRERAADAHNTDAHTAGTHDAATHDSWATESDHDQASRLRCLKRFHWRLPLLPRGRRFRKFLFVSGALGSVVLVAMLALWWRLSSGPIELDLATPWLTAAIKENFGSGHEVEIGGTQLERDASGRTALRIRDIVVRDADGTIVASAPKAEVGLSGSGLMSGRIRAERLSLVGAEMAVRIEPDSKITVFAGNRQRPFVTASASPNPLITGDVLPAARRAFRADRHGPVGAAAGRVEPQWRARFRRAARLGREPRRERPGWPRPHRDRPQGRQPHGRRSAQRQAVDVHQYRSQRHAPEGRRHRFHGRLRRR